MKVAIVLFCLFAHLIAQEVQERGEFTTQYPLEDAEDTDLTAESSKHHKIHHYKRYNHYTPTNYGHPQVYSLPHHSPGYNHRVYQPSYHKAHPIKAMKMYKKAMHKGIYG